MLKLLCRHVEKTSCLWCRGLGSIFFTFCVVAANGCLQGKVNSNMYPSDTKFAVIGAGPGGLSAALALKKKGFSNIAVYEKNDDVGGKVESYIYEGKPYELGAILLAGNFKAIHRIAEEFEVPLREYHEATMVDEDFSEHRFGAWAEAKFSQTDLFWSAFKYMWIAWREGVHNEPGFVDVPADLTLTMQEYVKKNDIDSLSDPCEPMIVGLGYGYYNEVPAAYLVKLFYGFIRGSLEYALGFGHNGLTTPVNGYQDLWRTVAQSLPVKLSTAVQKIEKDGEQWQVHTAQGIKSYDQVILSVPAEISAQLVPSVSELGELSKQVRYYEYQVTVLKVDNFDRDKTWYFRGNRQRQQLGYPIAMTNPHKDTNVYMVYTQTGPSLSEEQVLARTKETIEKMGGNVTEVLTQKSWRYLPHVTGEAMRAGFYDRWRELQGKQGLWYVGGLFNFETVEHTVRFSNDLVERHF